MNDLNSQIRIPCVGAVVRDDTSRILLIKRGHEPARGTWSLPGGRVEPGETHEQAVVREVHEETGISVDVIREVGTIERDAPTGGVYVIRDFLVAAAKDAQPVAGDDADDAQWFTPSEVRELTTSPGLVETLEAWGLLD